MKKLLSILLALCMCLSSAFALACGGDTPTPDDSGQTTPPVHTHSWGKWTSNNNGTHTRTCKEDSTHTETENCDKNAVPGGSCIYCGYYDKHDNPDYWVGNSTPDYIDVGTYNKEGTNKTVIKVMNHNGGIGSVWLEQAAERYAKVMTNTSYATGKKGVYIKIDKRMGVSGVVADAISSDQQIFFAEGRSYPSSWGQAGVVMNLDEIVYDTERDGGTLESKIFDTSKSVLQGTVDGEKHYYALPHYEYYGGASYNREIFDEFGAYFADVESCNPEYIYPYDSRFGTFYFLAPEFVNENDAVKSKGPDGLFNTEDDGLPCSFEQLVALCEYFKVGCEIAPIVISGACSNYMNFFITGLWSALAGGEQMKTYYSFDGKIEVVTGLSEEPIMEGIPYIKKPITKWVDVNTKTGYLGNDMAAKYYTLAFCEIVHKEGYFAEKELGTNTSHLDAQKTLIYGGKATKADNSKAAILMEASYWYNESDENLCFENYTTLTGDTHEIDLRFMALPTAYTTKQWNARVTEEEYAKLSVADKVGKEVHRQSALIDLGQAFCFINNNIKDNVELRNSSIDFVKYLYSESELRYFTIQTGMPRAITYDLSDEQQDAMGNFYKRLWNLRDWENGSNVVYCSPSVNADAEALNTFLKAKPTIALVLASPVLNFNNNSSPFHLLKDLSLNNDGTYKTGTSYCFEVARISASAWQAF